MQVHRECLFGQILISFNIARHDNRVRMQLEDILMLVNFNITILAIWNVTLRLS